MYGASRGKEHFIPVYFLAGKCFKQWKTFVFQQIFLTFILPVLLCTKIFLYFWCLLWSYLDVCVALYELENNGSKRKKKKPSVLINLAKWSEHFLRETMLHVGKIEAGARPFMLTARCKWMQTHLPKNSHASKNEFGVQGPQTIPDLTVFYP